MKKFEYKLVPTPRRSRRFSGLKPGGDSYAHTVEQDINYLAMEGWEFMRTEMMVKKTTGVSFFKSARPTEYMVFRRLLRENGASIDETVRPRRIPRRTDIDVEQVRDRARAIMGQNVAAGIPHPFVSTRNESA